MCSINTFDQNTRNHLTPTSIWALQPISEKMRLSFHFHFRISPFSCLYRGCQTQKRVWKLQKRVWKLQKRAWKLHTSFWGPGNPCREKREGKFKNENENEKPPLLGLRLQLGRDPCRVTQVCALPCHATTTTRELRGVIKILNYELREPRSVTICENTQTRSKATDVTLTIWMSGCLHVHKLNV